MESRFYASRWHRTGNSWCETQFLIVVIPEALQEQREEIERRIEQFIEEAQAEGEQQLEELSRRVQEWLIQEAQDALEGGKHNL